MEQLLVWLFIVSGESRRGGEEKMLEDLEKQTLSIYEKCVGRNQVQLVIYI